MRCLIYGAGAVGLGLAGFIAKAGPPVDILARADTAAALQRDGIVLTGAFGDRTAAPGSLRAASSLREFEKTPYSHILFCVKAYDLAEAARDVASREALLGPVMEGSCSVVLVQSGWGSAEACAAFFPDQRIFNARVTAGFARKGLNALDVTHPADAVAVGSLFGAPLGAPEALCRVIGEGGLPCRVTPDIEKDLWAGMLYRCALDPLGALLGVPGGVLGQWDYTRSIMDGIVREVFAVMEEAGHGTHWASAGDYLELFYGELLPLAAAQESPMLQDILRRGRTEIDALNGAVVRLGEAMSIPVTANSVVCRMLKFLEERTTGLKLSY